MNDNNKLILPGTLDVVKLQLIDTGIGLDIEKTSKIEFIELQNTITHLSCGLFSDFISLKEIKLSERLEYIEDRVFERCKNLKSVIIPDGVIHIGQFCFSRSGLEKIKLPESLFTLERGIFHCCINLKEIRIPKNVKCIKREAFFYCPNLKNVYIHNKNINIEKDAFYDSPNVKLIYLD